ncbi:MAG TPA: hypothetical protein ENK08_08745 [Chloroflexi bacterium]|nr:hypothetical protein [Chloroflexota bacterium]
MPFPVRTLCILVAACLAVGLLLLLLPNPAATAGGPPEIGTPVPVATTSEDSRNPDVAVAPDGTRHVVWEEVVSTTTYLYHAFSADGVAWTLPVTVSEGDSPALVVAAEGTPVLLFARYISPTVNIYATRYVSGAWRPPQRLSLGGNSSAPDIVVTPDGVLFAAWVERPTGQYVIYLARSDDGGATWPTVVPVVSVADPAVLGTPRLAAGTDGVVHLVWQKREGLLAAYDIFHKQRDPTTGRWDVVAANLSESPVSSFSPAVAATGGRAYALWEENGAIRACRGFTLTWTSPVTFSTSGTTATGAAAVLRGGPLHTAWDEGTVLRTSFGWRGSPTTLAQDASGIREAALDVGPDRLLHAVWSQGAAGASDVYYTYRRFAWVFLPLTMRH